MNWKLITGLLLCVSLERTYANTPTPVHITASASPSVMRVGEVTTVHVQVDIDPGWHVYSVVPAAATFGPSATAILALGGDQPESRTIEDAPDIIHDPNFNLQIGVHNGHVEFTRSFKTLGPPAPSRVSFHYQTCNDHICLPPTTVNIPIPLTLEQGPARSQYLNVPAQVASFKELAPIAFGTGNSGSTFLLFLTAAFGGGLLALLTPCVFPLIPITLTSFAKQADGDRRKLFTVAFTYSAGIIALFFVLGSVTTLAFGASGLSRLATNPWVNLSEFAVFVMFALSFFEVITLQLPAGLSRVQTAARQHGGTAGLLLMGLAFVLASFTCTAPFIGTLLVSAAGGARLRPILGMLAFGVAFVSPFLICGMFPQWISRIPRSGAWLLRAKAVLGFIELVAALKFLSNADLVWQWKLLTQPVLLAVWAVIFLATAGFLFGIVQFGLSGELARSKPRERLTAGRIGVGLVFVLAALYCFWGISGRPIHPVVASFLPGKDYGVSAVANDVGLLPWYSDYNVALTEAKRQGRPLLIDFTGYTCTNCRLNEHNVFPRPEIQTELAKYVRVQLYTDGGVHGAENQDLQQKLFQDVSLPLYGIVDPTDALAVDHTGGVISPSAFDAFLRRHDDPVQATTASAADTAVWAPYTPVVEASLATGSKPTIIDFTANWCVNCKAIENTVFSNPVIAGDLKSGFNTYRADLTNWASPSSMRLQKRYGFSSLPTVILLDATGREQKTLRVTGLVSVHDFLARLKRLSPTVK